MSKEGLSRRSFLRNTAVGTTGAALASLPAAHAGAAEVPPAPPWPVTEESYPLTAPGNAASQARMKLVTDLEFPRAYQEKLQAYAPNLDIKTCGTREEFRREVADSHIIFGGCNKEEFLAARQLRWIQYPAAGVEGILFPDLVESPVVLTNMQRMYSPTISETVIGLLITLTRRLNDYTLQTRERRWNALEGLREISGLTMGIVGMGGIGTDTAYRAHYGFHMRILATDPKPLPKPAFVAELHSPEWLPKMVPQVDVLLSAAPHTPLTHHMFNDEIFRLMKPSAYFINVSRGWLVDSSALVSALKERRIAGAALDATEPEPLPPDHPLWTAGNIIITSHTSAVSAGSTEKSLDLFCENVRRYTKGLPLLNVVDKKRGY
ncbi:MAG: NAD(P)-dependent oxidoreductase [Terriglobia bacterium]|jgi:phosphoglycerate dehydrogenase-like enzyme